MRPLRLTLQAFGSYAGEVTVDFARLSRHGVFAITGPTGSGKSTIFDALVYALYDDLPGFRVDGNVRSQYAADTVETRVRLELSVRGERWAVERVPAQRLRRRRGQGTYERKSTVLLERLTAEGAVVEGSGMSRKAAVRDQIDALVGLTKAQFEQVVLIPQGRFEQVLKADTAARAVLLRRLFPADVYGRVTAALKEMADERHRAFSDASRAFDDIVERVRVAIVAALGAAGVRVGDERPELAEPGALDVDDLARHLADVRRARLGLERSFTAAEAESDRSAQALEHARRGAEAWDRWRADTALVATFAVEEAADAGERVWLDRARRVADLDGALSDWERAVETLATGVPRCDALREQAVGSGAELTGSVAEPELLDARAASRVAERLRHEAELARTEAIRFGALVEEGRTLAARAAELGRRREAVDRRSDELAVEHRVLEDMARSEAALVESELGLAAAEHAVRSLEAERDVCLRRAGALDELSAAELERDAAAVAAVSAQGRARAARAAWRDGLAWRLAELLVDGEPCPTCGALEHPVPAHRPEGHGRGDDALDDEALGAETLGGGRDDEALARAEAGYEVAQAALLRAEARHAAARSALDTLGALGDVRPLTGVDAELAARRVALSQCHDAVGQLAGLREELARRRTSLEVERAALDARSTALEVDAARLADAGAAHDRARADYGLRHGGFVSPAQQGRELASLAADVDRLAQLLCDVEQARSSEHRCRALLDPLLCDLGLADPAALGAWRCDPGELAGRGAALAARADAREGVRRRIAEYEGAGGPSERPDVASMEVSAKSARALLLDVAGHVAVMEESAGFLAAAPPMLEMAAKEMVTARTALEHTRTMADRCAGAGGGASPTRLSLENWVLADYLRQVLVQANSRLATMTAGRFALALEEGVTDGRKAWGLELSAFDAYTGQVRPATTLSGGETFMAALALALGLADVVSGGSNRDIGALFVDEGFGSLDPQSLDAVVDVLRSLEDGGRLVGVVSHVEAVQQAVAAGMVVRTGPCGSVLEVRYPAE